MARKPQIRHLCTKGKELAGMSTEQGKVTRKQEALNLTAINPEKQNKNPGLNP